MKRTRTIFTLIAVALLLSAAAPVAAEQAEKPAVTPAAEKSATPAAAALTGKLNINTATVEQISLLPGIGGKKAQAIIDYRAANGNFKKAEDLMNVRGIKEKKLDKIREYIIFEGETTLKAAG